MRKNKSFLALSALGVIALILMVAAGVLLSGQRAVSFRADGYVLDTAKQDDDTLEVVTDQFVAGSSWHTNSMGTISLKDLEGQTFQVEEDSFIHYNDASLSAFADGSDCRYGSGGFRADDQLQCSGADGTFQFRRQVCDR